MTNTPLWERQPNERLQLYIYKKIYIMEIKKANKELKDIITYIEKLPNHGNNEKCKEFEGHLIEIPNLKQLQNASSKWCWNQADENYTNYLTELDNKKKEENYQTSTDKVDTIIDDMFELVEDSVEELKNTEYKTSTKIQLQYTLSRTIDLLTKNKRLNHGRPTTISKSDVDVDTKIEFDGVDNLIGAFHASKKEWTKHKQSK